MGKQNPKKRITVNRYEEYAVRQLRKGERISPAFERLFSNKMNYATLRGIENTVMAKYLMLRESEKPDYIQDPVCQKIKELKMKMLPEYWNNVPNEIKYFYKQFIDRKMPRETYEMIYNLSPELLKLRFALLYGCKFRDDSPKDTT
jgi:hypothetical protein